MKEGSEPLHTLHKFIEKNKTFGMNRQATVQKSSQKNYIVNKWLNISIKWDRTGILTSMEDNRNLEMENTGWAQKRVIFIKISSNMAPNVHPFDLICFDYFLDWLLQQVARV